MLQVTETRKSDKQWSFREQWKETGRQCIQREFNARRDKAQRERHKDERIQERTRTVRDKK